MEAQPGVLSDPTSWPLGGDSALFMPRPSRGMASGVAGLCLGHGPGPLGSCWCPAPSPIILSREVGSPRRGPPAPALFPAQCLLRKERGEAHLLTSSGWRWPQDCGCETQKSKGLRRLFFLSKRRLPGQAWQPGFGCLGACHLLVLQQPFYDTEEKPRANTWASWGSLI